MIKSDQINPGMTLSIDGKIFRVESSVKVTVAKGVPFIKTTLKNLMTDETVEKNFKLEQEVEDVSLSERKLEYLYREGKDYLFIDINELREELVATSVIGDKINYLKEGTELNAMFYGETIFSVELPQYLELIVAKTEAEEAKVAVSHANKIAILETGAKVEVPLFIEAGDIIKVDTQLNEYVQRI